jgi:multidrug efflux pump subunit AcrA (membrane-fusion protein)
MRWLAALTRDPRAFALRAVLALVILVVLGAGIVRTVQGQNPARRGGEGGPRGDAGPPSVDVVLARAGTLRAELAYTGTTRADREVTVRPRTEGRLIQLNVDVGDRVTRGQELARLDSELLRTALNEAEAELASRRSEASAVRAAVSEARTRVEQARLDHAQKHADYQRSWRLWGQGYESRQATEQRFTAARVARQVISAAQEQVRNLQQAAKAADARVAAQRAVVAQERERLSYAVLRSPVEGFVTARLVDGGDLVQPGEEVVRVGDFRVVRVDVEVSELELRHVSVGQPARLSLDALGGEEFTGRVERISPQADPVSRLVPVTVTLRNPRNRIGAGMLARVRFGSTAPQRVLIPETALQPGARGGGDESASEEPAERPGTVFVVEGGGRPASPDSGATGGPVSMLYTVRERQVRVSATGDGQAEVTAGLEPGERVVSRSSRPLEDGTEVRPSILSAEALGGSRGDRSGAGARP